MLVPSEKDLRAAMAGFAAARIEHDVRPTGVTSRVLEDTTYTLCVLTGAKTAEEALRRADALLERYGAERRGLTQEDETLAA